MDRPVVAVVCNTLLVDGRMTVHAVGERNLLALVQAAEVSPILIPALPGAVDVGAILSIVHGVLLVGGRANVHPSRFGIDADPRHEPYDEGRDAVALDIVRACVAGGVPLLGVCRGLQEMNVAFGGTLHPEVSELPGRMNHRGPRLPTGEFHPDPKVVFADRHVVRLAKDGAFSRLFDAETIVVNSLHGQAILQPAERVFVEGIAEDDTIEAISIRDASGFALGVQWHAEYDPQGNRTNRLLFEAFGRAAAQRRHQAGRA